MSNEKLSHQTLSLMDQFEQFLNQMSEEEFQRSPVAGGWSYSEVYSHIFSANHACLLAIQHCIQGKGIESSEKASFVGRLILFFGVFPPVKIKAPERIAAMVKKISKVEALDQVQKFRENLQALVPQIAQASPTQKAKHPRMGLFTAPQWLSFIQIHTKHHLKQLYRIQAALSYQIN
ncbi:MAG: hypothetical protein RI924_487 [Bacteroidota bacterium]|jgi:hypothetical protein